MVSTYIPSWRRELEAEYPGFQAIREMVHLYHGETPIALDDKIKLLKEIARYTVTPPAPESDGGGMAGVTVQILVPGSTADAIKANVITEEEHEKLEYQADRQADLL